ncbi:Plant phosphoribosyltransferase C-terminal [Musa troglodytarum]|uniref:Plant phosphoribosyltransferase C-terminal n=1 Tax=Musa troglodytarum TaxID=320322 RepID=A0A9E7KS24_9LILI|nr:Plant phosphoribosyltransferase C-terminal [Musa troglodytarum]
MTSLPLPVSRKLAVEVIDARDLLPKDGHGTSSPYVVVEFDGQRKQTHTVPRDLNPQWNERLEFVVADNVTLEDEELNVEVYNDKRMGSPSGARKNHFLGRVRIYGSQFARRGEEGLIYFPLEKRNLLSWIRGVFDNWRMFDAAGNRQDYRIGKVRIRVSTLESNRVYTASYPLLRLLPSGVKKMGEVQLAVRFACAALLPNTCAMYAQPMLPRMHHLRPLGVLQQDVLRVSAIMLVSEWLERSEPPLGQEVVRYMLDVNWHSWSNRRSRANWFRIMGVVSWAFGLARWIDDIRRWRNPTTTVLVHVLYLVLVWYPELVVPTASLYVFLIGAWYSRFRPRAPAGMDVRLSQADMVDADDLDEEFDPVPSTKPAEVVRARYDRLRILAARVQRLLGDLAAQGERVQALISWRDPRATKLFIGACLVVALVFYVVPPKMIAVALGFYFLRHPMFRDPMPPASLNFFRRLPSLSDRML